MDSFIIDNGNKQKTTEIDKNWWLCWWMTVIRTSWLECLTYHKVKLWLYWRNDFSSVEQWVAVSFKKYTLNKWLAHRLLNVMHYLTLPTARSRKQARLAITKDYGEVCVGESPGLADRVLSRVDRSRDGSSCPTTNYALLPLLTHLLHNTQQSQSSVGCNTTHSSYSSMVGLGSLLSGWIWKNEESFYGTASGGCHRANNFLTILYV